MEIQNRKIAAIYCRVSGEAQEREGTSLDSQREADLAKGKELGYDTPGNFVLSEVGSRLTLDRLELNQIRQWVRDKQVDAVIIYALDRLSGDPVHIVILEDELERHGVQLIAVTEDIDSSDLGKLVSYIRGYAAKLEVEKIRERTMRGIRERVKAGKMPSGRRARLYGYTYLAGKGVGEGVRYVNEAETRWVREMFHWLVEEHLTLNGITYRLRTLGVPTPSGKGFWIRSTVYKILTNPAYVGRTYCFTHIHKETEKHYKENRKARKTSIEIKPYEEGIEIKGATPPIIEPELFEAAQARLRRNKQQSKGNGKVKYLLRGHIYCARCGRKYCGYARWQNGEPTSDRRYYCMGKRSIITPVKCDNKGYKADYLEELCWEKIEAVLSQPETALVELRAKQEDLKKVSFLEREVETITKQLANRERQRDRVYNCYYITGDEDKFRRDIASLNEEVKALKERQEQIKNTLSAREKIETDINGIKKACELMKSNLKTLNFEEKRLALETLDVKLFIDGDNLTITGGVQTCAIVSTQAGWSGYNTTNVFPFELGLRQ